MKHRFKHIDYEALSKWREKIVERFLRLMILIMTLVLLEDNASIWKFQAAAAEAESLKLQPNSDLGTELQSLPQSGIQLKRTDLA